MKSTERMAVCFLRLFYFAIKWHVNSVYFQFNCVDMVCMTLSLSYQRSPRSDSFELAKEFLQIVTYNHGD